MRDIIFHTQWCAALSMVAVQWPVFVCASIRVFHFSNVVLSAIDQIPSSRKRHGPHSHTVSLDLCRSFRIVSKFDFVNSKTSL